MSLESLEGPAALPVRLPIMVIRTPAHDPGARVRTGAIRLAALAVAAMTAFAANSVLARLALGGDLADPSSFTLVRVWSGAAVLVVFVTRNARPEVSAPWLSSGSWRSAALLAGYAAAFSYAYVSLGAAAGALVLFAVVQVVMFGAALRAGEHPGRNGWVGLGLAAIGVATLAAPGVSAPEPRGVILMSLAGASWAGYTLRGRNVDRPIDATAANFVRGAPLVLALSVVALVLDPSAVHLTLGGVVYAAFSGSVASALGYALWYAVLPKLTRAQSGVIQLSPAPLAAVAGLLLIGEPITVRLVVASTFVLGGVALSFLPRSRAESDL